MAKNLTLANVLRLLGAIGGASVAGGFGGVGGGISRWFWRREFPFGEGDNDVANELPNSQNERGPEDAENNATLQRATAQKAAKMQERESNRALTQFLRPGQSKAERIEGHTQGQGSGKEAVVLLGGQPGPRIPITRLHRPPLESIRITPDNRAGQVAQARGTTSWPQPTRTRPPEAFRLSRLRASGARWPILTRNIKGERKNNLGGGT